MHGFGLLNSFKCDNYNSAWVHCA